MLYPLRHYTQIKLLVNDAIENAKKSGYEVQIDYVCVDEGILGDYREEGKIKTRGYLLVYEPLAKYVKTEYREGATRFKIQVPRRFYRYGWGYAYIKFSVPDKMMYVYFCVLRP